MHKHKAASTEQEGTQSGDAGSPRGPQRQWEGAPRRSPAGTPPGPLAGDSLRTSRAV